MIEYLYCMTVKNGNITRFDRGQTAKIFRDIYLHVQEGYMTGLRRESFI